MMLKIFSLFLLLFVTACLIDYSNGGQGNFAKTATTLVQLRKWKKTAHQNAEKTAQKSNDETEQKSIEYIEHVMEEYGTPVPISRVVKTDKNDQLYSTDKSMQTILDFVYKILDHSGLSEKNTLKELAKDLPADGCYVTFSVEKDINPKAFLFEVGTTVPANDVEDLEIFEERETGRREIRQKSKKKMEEEKDEEKKEEEEKGALLEKEKKEGEDGEQEEEEEEEDEEGDEPTKLSTLAAILAIQKGRKGFGDKSYLNYENLPRNKDKHLLRKIDAFFQQLIDACDGRHDPKATETTETIVKEEEIKYKELDEINMVEFMDRARKGEGKLENGEDVDLVEKELEKNFDKLLKGIMVATDKERNELKNVIEKTKEEIHTQLEIDYTQREKLAAQEKVDAYNFLQTIHYTIGTRPAYIGFKKLNVEEFNELVRLAEDPAALQNEIENEKNKLTDLQERIADAMIYEETSSLSRTKSFIWQKGVAMGKSFVKMFKKSKEETSGEQIKRLESAKEDEEKLIKKRRTILHEAIQMIQDEKNVNCLKLKTPIQLAIYGNSDVKVEKGISVPAEQKKPNSLIDALMQDVQARLGAQAVNSMINTKRFPEGHSLAVKMSVFGSGLIGVFLDVALVPFIILGATHIFGPLPWIGAAVVIIIKFVVKPLLESMTPLVAETFDSAIIKDYMESLKGKKFWRGIKHFRKSIIGAMESGMIAAAGSVLFNFSMLLPSHFFVVQLVLNVLGTFTSAAMVPKELAKTRDQTMKAIYKMKETGFFERPSEEFKKDLAKDMRKQIRKNTYFAKYYRTGFNKKEEIKAAYTNWIEQQTWRTMEVEQASRLSINSMGIGPLVSSVIFTMMQGVTEVASFIPETATSAVSVMFNAPTEMISFTGAIIGANNLGLERFPWLMSNDEQKNLQIMAKIFEKSSKQYENIMREGKDQFEEITDAELHKIYNPFINTMSLGRWFVRKGIWLWKKWDQFKQRNEYKRKELAGLAEHNPNKLIVENWKPGMVYLITLPRTNTVQNLSPKALALEFWLRINMEKNHFYLISDGLFVRQLFNEQQYPYVEFNGQKIQGTLHEIIAKISVTKTNGKTAVEKQKNIDEDKNSQEFYNKNIKPLEKALEEERKWGGMDFIVEDKALLEEMISTMSQLYPKLVEYEVDNVDSWDAMPWQLKQTFKITIPFLTHRKRGKHLDAVGKEPTNWQKIIESMEEIATHIKLHENGELHVVDQKSTITDAALFGILAQMFETSFNRPYIQKYIQTKKPKERVNSGHGENPNNDSVGTSNNDQRKTILYKYYKKLIEKMGGQAWTGLKTDPFLNYDYQVKVGAKYNGQFQLHLAKMRNGKNVDMSGVNTFAYIHDIIHEPEPDVARIEAEMRAEKVNHEWVGPLWKVKRQWKDGEFEQELDKRVEDAKRKMHRENVDQTFLQHYSYPVEAITDRLIDLVWDSTDNIGRAVEFASPHENAAAVNSLEGAEKELGTMLFNIITKYKQGRGVDLAQNGADNHVFRELVLYDKTGKFFAQRINDIMLNGVDKFYDQECTKLIVELFGRDIPLSISNPPKDHSDKKSTTDLEQKEGENTPLLSKQHSAESSKWKMPMKEGDTSTTNLEDSKSTPIAQGDNLERRKNRIETLLNDMQKERKKFTLKRLTERAEHVFNLEIGELLGNTVKYMKETKIGDKTIAEQIPVEMNDLNCETVKLLDRQREAIEYIDKNRMRLIKDKSRQGAVDRMFRVFDRYIGMKQQAQDCFETLEQMTHKMANRLEHVVYKTDQPLNIENALKKELEGTQWKELKAKVHKMEGHGLQRQDANEAQKVDDDFVKKLEEHFANTAVKTDRKNRMETIKMELDNFVKMEKWRSLKVEVEKFDDGKLRETLTVEKKQLEETINKLDNHRKEKINKNIPAIYTWNEAMREFVKDKIIESDNDVTIDAEALSAEKLVILHKKISKNLNDLAQAENDRPLVVRNYLTNVAKKVNDQMHEVIGPSQTEVLEKMPDIHNKHRGAEALKSVRENVTKAIGGYTVVKEAINLLDPRIKNADFKTNMTKMIDDQIGHVKKLSETVAKFNGNRMETKKNILAKLAEIKPEMIAANAKTLKSFWYVIKWTKKIPKEEVEAKHTALQALIKELEKEEESDRTLQTLAQIDAKIDLIYAGQIEEKKKLSNFVHASLEGQKLVDTEMTIKKIDTMISDYADGICELEKADKIFAPIENAELRKKMEENFKVESKELCAQRTGAGIVEALKFKKIDEKSSANVNPAAVAETALKRVVDVIERETYFNEKIAKFVDEENKKFRIRKARQIKYPIAKAMLHLMAAYLCVNVAAGGHVAHGADANAHVIVGNGDEDKCGQIQRELAFKELEPFGIQKDEAEKLVNNVKQMVYFTIGDFNENFIIREEIVKQFGKPLMKEIEKEL